MQQNPNYKRRTLKKKIVNIQSKMSIDFNLTNLHKDAFEKLNLIIPRDQVERTLLSRQSHILNSNYADPAFDTFISLCQRIFNVSSTVIFIFEFTN